MIIVLKTITDIISIITVAQLILFGLFLLMAKKGKSSDKIALAFFLFANGIYILNFLTFRYYEVISSFTLNIFFIGGTFGFLFGPLLYLYSKAITSKEFRFKKKDILHLIPFIIIFCLTLVRFQIQPYETKLVLLRTGLYGRTGSTIYLILMNLITLVYLLGAFLVVRNRNKNLKVYYSSLEKINFDWLKFVVSAFFIMWIVDIINWLADSFQLNIIITEELLTFLSLFINFVFANLLILKNLHLPELKDDLERSGEKHKYEKSPLTEHNKSEILLRLKELMRGEKLFLQPALNLGDVANKLSIPTRYLSQVINELKGQNFYDFINNYRIEEAKKILGDTAHKEDTILSILYECGFNSKSVFNTAFKKSTGVTPSEYRRKYRKSA